MSVEVAPRQALYTVANGFMVEHPRPNRINKGEGVKIFEGQAIPHYSFFNQTGVTSDDLRALERGVWRAEETLDAANLLSEHGKVLIVGGPQSGKGTILYGVSSICDIENWRYTMIDGHWLDSSKGSVVAAIKEAQRDGNIIFYDSFDYLFAGSRKIRKSNALDHAQRTEEIIDALSKVTVPLVATAHGGYWSQLFLNEELLEKHNAYLSTVPVYELPRQLQSAKSQRMFLIDHGYFPHEADALIEFPSDPQTVDIVTNNLGDKRVLDDLALAVNDYAVLKMLAREIPTEIQSLIADSESTESRLILIQTLRECLSQADFLATLRKTG